MNDPHVEELIYEVSSEGIVEYDSPPPISFRDDLGIFALDAGVLCITLAHHFADPREAREPVEAFLRSWEMESDLLQNIGTIRFKYKDAKVVDAAPPPPGSPNVVNISAQLSAITVEAHATLSARLSRYPDPPSAFRSTPGVLLAYQRWRQYRAEQEPLQAMAYAVLTLAYSTTGGRDETPGALGISGKVLRTIGKLSSQPGLNAAARKLDVDAHQNELTGKERSWLESATKQLILRMGESVGSRATPEITMADLPPC